MLCIFFQLFVHKLTSDDLCCVIFEKATTAVWSPAAEKDVLGLFDDFLQQPLTMLQVGDLRFVVGQRPSKPKPLVAKGGASRVWHHHRTQLLFVELRHKNKSKH